MIEKSVSIIVPVYNEADIIERVMKNLVKLISEEIKDFEILIVESGSTDATPEIVDNLDKEFLSIRAIHQKDREGIGSAVYLGYKNAKKDYYFWMDGDEPYDIKDLFKALQLIDSCDIVAGYRANRDEGLKRLIYSTGFKWLTFILFQQKIRDINFSFKLYSAKIFDNIVLESNWGFHAAESIIKAKRKGFNLKQMGVKYTERLNGETKLGNMSVAFKTLKEMVKIRLTL